MKIPRNTMLKIIDMKGCGFVPANVVILQATWHKYREKLEDILIRHQKLFPNFTLSFATSGRKYSFSMFS